MHDVFVSYSHDDEAEVNELLEVFRNEDIDAVTDATFTVGKDLEKMIRESIDDSRHVALMLTPAWIKRSTWTTYEAALARVRDRDGELGVVIPIILKECEIPDLFRSLLHADLWNEKRRARDLQRVINAIRASKDSPMALPLQPERAPVLAQQAVQALQRLSEIAGHESVRIPLLAFRDQIASSSRHIQLLADLKDVHEQLHELQLQFYRVIGSRMSGVTDMVPFAKLYALAIETAVRELREIASRNSISNGDLTWIAELGDLQKDLRQAIAANQQETARSLIDVIEHRLGEHSGGVNARLRQVLQLLRLPDLLAAIDAVCAQANALLLTADDRTLFLEGMRTLRKLVRNLTALIMDHDRWQNTDTSLRLVDRTLHERINNLAITWRRIAGEVEVLDEPMESMDEARAEIEKAIEKECREEAWDPYQRFRHYTISQFNKVDRSLKKQCDELRFVGVPLAELSRKLA